MGSYITSALVVALYALSHNPEKLLRARRRYVMWTDLGLNARGTVKRVYTTRVAGRTYKRVVVVVEDKRVLRVAKKLVRDEARLKRLIRRYMQLARTVLGRIHVTSLDWIQRLPRRLGRRLFGLEPFDMDVYNVFRRRRYVRQFRGDARAWGYVLYEIASRCGRLYRCNRPWRLRAQRTDVIVYRPKWARDMGLV